MRRMIMADLIEMSDASMAQPGRPPMPGISETRHWLGAKSLRYTVAVGRGAAAQGHRQVFAVSPPPSRAGQGVVEVPRRVPIGCRRQTQRTICGPTITLQHLPFPHSQLIALFQLQQSIAVTTKQPPQELLQPTANTRDTAPPPETSSSDFFPNRFDSIAVDNSPALPGPVPLPARPPTDPARPHPHPESGPLACTGPPRGLPSLQATAHFPVRDPQSSNSPAI